MAPDLSEKLLGIDIDDADDRRRQDTEGQNDDEEELEQFLFFGLGDYQLAIPVDTVRTLADVPGEMTRVPRAPTAVEGMVDLRGEITAVIDPRVHFPDIEATDQSGRERLLVLDRPADQQSAAVHVDTVVGVETVPVSDVLDENSIEDRPLAGNSLTHPLVVALIQQERESEPDISDVVGSSGSGVDATADAGRAGGGATLSATPGAPDGADDAVGEQFALEPDAEPSESEPAEEQAPTREVVVEGTPLIDVDKLLLASGQRK